MMNEFMKTLLSLSVSGTLLFLLIWGLKPLYQNRFSKRWQYYIWIIAALRFLLPFTPDTTVVGSLFNGNPESPHTLSAPNIPYEAAVGTPTAEHPLDAAVRHNSLDLYGYLFFLWLAFALAMLTRKITVYQGFVRYVRAGNAEVSDIDMLNLLSDCEEKLNVKTRAGLYRNALISSPILIGFLRPSIILPVKKLGEKELSYIFTHELIHCQRRDMFYKWLIQLSACVHWFNPFVYLLGREVNRACELSCDEAVISILGDKAKREYGDTLISFVKTNDTYKSSLASVTLTEGAAQLKERLGAIMNVKRKSKSIKVVTALSTCILCFCFAAAGAYAAPTRPKEEAAAEQEYSEQKIKEEKISSSGDKTYRSVYTQEGYYWNSYIIEMGWNLYNDQEYYSDRKELTLEDGSTITVSFADTAKEYLEDSQATAAVNGLISYLKGINTYPTIETPLVVKISYVGDKDKSALIEEYYRNGDICSFSALFSLLDKTEQSEWYQKIYDADQIALFSTVIRHMDNDFITSYAAKAVQDGKTNFFSVILGYMQPDAIGQYAQKFYEADDIARFSIIVSDMTEDEQREWLKRAQADKKNTFSAVLSHGLSE